MSVSTIFNIPGDQHSPKGLLSLCRFLIPSEVACCKRRMMLSHLVVSTNDSYYISKAEARVGLEHTCGRVVNKKDIL